MKTKILFLVLLINLQQLTTTWRVKDPKELVKIKEESEKEVRDLKIRQEKDMERKIQEFTHTTAKGYADTNDAEYFKQNALQILYSTDPQSPLIQEVENMTAEEYKKGLLQHINDMDVKEFAESLKKEKKPFEKIPGHPGDQGGAIKPTISEDEEVDTDLGKNIRYGFEPRETLSLEFLKKRLKLQEFYVTQQAQDEYPGSGKYIDCNDPGMYNCIVCSRHLFSSIDKYKSEKGYAAFNKAIGDVFELEYKQFTLAKCENCGSHLGNVSHDDPNSETSRSYLINSLSLEFVQGYEYIN